MEFLSQNRPHALCVPLPFQSHINAMLKLAKLLHFKGFHVTFVNTEFNHQKVLQSRGMESLDGLPNFRFETIPDGLPPCDINATQEIPALWDTFTTTCLIPLCNLITKLNEATASGDPPVSCIVSDALISAALDAAETFNIPGVLLWTMSASLWMCYLYYDRIADEVLIPHKGDINEHLNMPINFIRGVPDMRLKDLPSFFWDGNDHLNNIGLRELRTASKASAVLVNTFDALERKVLDEMKSLLPGFYTIGPLQLMEQRLPYNNLKFFRPNLLKENTGCLHWLDKRQPNSVLYVNFGSTTVLTLEQLLEFAWGLANSKYPFLWVVRHDLVIGEKAVLPPEFIEQTVDRAMISGWCPQEEVLCHSSIAGFLTHSGWNSTLDTICAGVPLISWPFFGDQQTNCRCACTHWGIGLEIDKHVKRDAIEGLVRELMEGEKSNKMKENATQLKKSAEDSTKPGGSSFLNLHKMVQEVLLQNK